jgi:ApaG protein
MTSAITQGVKISVKPRYEELHSSPDKNRYVFSYHISIENQRTSTIQLLKRHWYIKDSILELREVEGEGVIGVQPIIRPGEIHEYMSWCPLKSEIGQMSGSYKMIDRDDSSYFDVVVPAFTLFATPKCN